MLLPDTGDWKSAHGSLPAVFCKWPSVLSMTSVGVRAIAGDRVASVSGVGCKIRSRETNQTITFILKKANQKDGQFWHIKAEKNKEVNRISVYV